jgi:hypothetical protein
MPDSLDPGLLSVSGGCLGESSAQRSGGTIAIGFGIAANQAVKGCSVQGFGFKQPLGYQVQLSAVLHKDSLSLAIRLVENSLNLFVDFLRGSFAAITLECSIKAGQVSALLTLSTSNKAHGVAHAENTNHLPSQSRGMLKIVFGPCGDLLKDHFFGGSPTEHTADSILKL